MSEPRVYLRPFVPDDVTESYLGWFRDPDVTRFLDARNISREDALDHLARGRKNNAWFQYAVCGRQDDRHVGNVKIGPIRWEHRVSDLVTVIGERSVWGLGHAREAIGLAIGIAFQEHGLRKLSASIDSLNTGSIRAYTAAGFEIEASLRDQFMGTEGGRPVLSDKVYVSCFNPAQRADTEI